MDGELEALLRMARDLYKEEVPTGKKSYDRFADDFFHSIQFVSCDGIPFKNAHNRNVHIVRGIMSHEKQARRFLFAAQFSHADFLRLMEWYNHLGGNPPTTAPCGNNPPDGTVHLSLGCNMTHEQMVRIVEIANANHLFCVEEVTFGMMEDLLSCKEGYSVQVNNIARLATLFDALVEEGMVVRNWQNIMEQGHFLTTPKGSPISASNLSSSLCGTHRCHSRVHQNLRREVRRLVRNSE